MFDIKIPIGLFFSIVGFILMLSGVFEKSDVLNHLGFNFNLWWGIAILGFGLTMLFLAFFEKKGKNKN